MDVTATRPATRALDVFHPAVAAWFRRTFAAPTGAQALAWPHIKAGRSTLVAAPTGSGKTLTAFLCALDELVRDALAHDGALPDATLVVYVSPLKALSNDIHVNLDAPLAGIAESLAQLGLPVPEIRTAVRTGDTTQAERAALRKRAPHILVTTPESLYVLLSSTSGRQMLSTVRSVIVDEIHALASSKRGSHLALSLERLDALTGRALPRIGLSATQKPIDAVARFLVGGPADAPRDCTIVDTGHARERDLALELPNVPLEPVMATDVWEQVYDRIAALAAAHRTTLVFVNTRRTAERMARHLAERLGKDAIAAHHGSLAKEHRFDAEQRLKRGELKLLVATASLELGIDIGDVDLVCQVGSPRGIAPFLQRVGRSGHHVGGMPKGRLFPLSRDELVECAALLDCVRRGELDTLRIPQAPLDVLAQQIVAEVACAEWQEDALYASFTRAAPYAHLSRERFDEVMKMLAEGFSSRRGVRAAYLHRDVVGGTVRGRRSAMMTATTSGGTIPDMADYAVLLEPQGIQVGTVNEDFAVESLAGDVFQLGNQSYRIIRVETGRVRVEDAHGQSPSIPFWLGEAPGRSDELSAAVGRLRAQLDALFAEGERHAHAGAKAATAAKAKGGVKSASSAGNEAEAASGAQRSTAVADPANNPAAESRLAPALHWLVDALRVSPDAARQIADYLVRARAALGALPTQDTLVMERFFDESGGMQLVIHSPYGSRINRAWGLALRKRFCRNFNFELQAAATDDAIVLSLSLAHSFALDEVWRYLRSASAEHVLIQALLDAPLFGVRWRWNATTALALPRFTGGKRTAPQLQRMKSDDLLATVFPDQVACLENVVGEREIPHHPLVDQTLDDCLHDAMDTDGWLALLRRIESGAIELVARDLPAPSPLAAEILNAKPYAFLDDAPLEERRTQAVQSRRWSDPESADDLGALDADAIDAVRDEAWPLVRDADEMHDALLTLACIADDEAQAHEGWPARLAELAERRRATKLATPDGAALWVPVERLVCLRALHPDARVAPALKIPAACAEPWEADAALVDVIRARLTGFGPLPLDAIAKPLGLPPAAVATALAALEREGYVMRGRFTPGTTSDEWCERHLLARIHRYTVKRLRREIEPVERADFMRFLFHWQHLTPDTRGTGRDALAAVVEQLEGYEAAAGAWEDALLPARLTDYTAGGLDDLCRSGKLVWTRIGAPARAAGTPVKTTPIVLLPRRHLGAWQALRDPDAQPVLSARAAQVRDALAAHGAMFFDALLDDLHMLPVELEQALGELVSAGLVNADSFAGLRALLKPAVKRSATYAPRTRRGGALIGGMDDAGRWALVQRPAAPLDTPATKRGALAATDPDALEHIAWTLLRRYGVVFWRLLEREADWLPSWRELVRVLQRLEARGEIRGGRFVAGLAGEQFALPEAIPILRELRRQPGDGQTVCVTGVDPLNLVGTLLPGDKVPALAGNRVLFRDGVPVASLVSGAFHYALDLSPAAREDARLRLARRC
ncbi:DEAD/DEAH box helicase [Burkholderia pseudomultivorans]|uniref:ATP-dependent DNA helicase RecQ n=1 Tax=Burkholderia pseudomultivorans TaxID=1207504 RepID=A0ABU2DZF8_9BURK|nr:DEAD/DEAH box helicase [Burkholderia pseudomultivorans]MDR8728935.1 ATP-dependent DNA helicase RecQ [Burkholderia pseudomultivorans]MDR8732707.1 ATP-dependent DNA helicase RecQ [Burkholderia pseudomultivorans]MDR8739573.1 ATP-dependent DNA helicase RecQ [Burkholderia pseudomultivorans]MDR8752809.1 ATP-dependent DNA helicase RecQ [Burkholderia pseudomultivorans]MDR8778096.1 ATP-dependent DNA helicase RecQ [Burkholderia pseudomultivorans]